ncbi:MAG: cupin domain-containing protein [Halobacteriota archaeon]
MINAEKLIKQLGLKPHPEGGYYRETYRSDEMLGTELLPERYIDDDVLGQQFTTC